MFHPFDELAIKPEILFIKCVYIISVRSKGIMQKIHLKKIVIFKSSGLMEPVVLLPGAE